MRQFARHAFLVLLVAGLGLIGSGRVATAAPTEEQLRFFESKVRPVLLTHCGKCHGAEKQEGKLRLDQPDGIRRGGMSGPVLVPGKPDQSLLVNAIRYQDENLQMPPDAKLPTQPLADLIEWVRQGAAMPGGDAAVPAPLKAVDDQQIARGREFWAFQPPRPVTLPAVKNSPWLQGPIDALILDALERANLHPVAPADRGTLLRRATFDLTGLPPTPDEVRDFSSESGPDAFARLADRLLASPRYGERWARHWLDVARYADSNGLDENVAFGNAWRYRDYVVAALNHDKTYDEFLREQVAGDLMPAGDDPALRNERLIATGFLALGPKVLAEVDEKKMEMDIVDEQIDSFGRSILGLTMGCCRCHDHKYDPLGMNDYYALAGIFKSTRTMEHFKKVARWHENPIPTPEQSERKTAHERQVAEKKAAIEKVVAQATARVREALKPGEEPPKDPETAFPEETKAELKRLRDELAALEKAAPEVPSAMGASESQIADVAIHVRGSHLSLGQVVPRHFPRVLEGAAPPAIAPDRSGRRELADWLVNPEHPLTSRVMANRVWRWHFGRGIVASTDNFGLLGDRPTNPPLLDWLARQLVANGWSLKSLHRAILLSSTYQLSSHYDERAAAVDPENRLHWRAPVERLEAEAVRDAILMVSGSLDRTMGGSLLHVKNRDYLFDHTSKDGTKYDSPRRSIYLPVIRNNLYDVFQLFDYADAAVLNGNRDSTTVAPQALFMLNSQLVTNAADSLAAELLRGAESNDAQRVDELYLRAFGRSPAQEETRRALSFLEQVAATASGPATAGTTPGGPSAAAPAKPADARRQAWTWLCQSILSSNEFIYVR